MADQALPKLDGQGSRPSLRERLGTRLQILRGAKERRRTTQEDARAERAGSGPAPTVMSPRSREGVILPVQRLTLPPYTTTTLTVP